MRPAFLATSIFIAISLNSPVSAEGLRIASWNIANLAKAPGKELRSYVRTEADYDQLRSMIAGMAPDVIALQEMGSIPAVEAVLGGAYAIQFETRRVTNDEHCRKDMDEIYNAVAYRKDLEGVLETFQIDTLAVLHTSECSGDRPRRVRGGVGVRVRRDNATYWIPSLHLPASCKTNRDEISADQFDDCGTQRVQFDRSADDVQWPSAVRKAERLSGKV
jgi:Endonuclease/Exonuclease/phosphatase family